MEQQMAENRHGVLPFGFKFKPKNAELIWCLLHKVNGLPLPCDRFIIDCDLYDGRDLWRQLFDGSPAATTHLYFFTKLKKVTEKGIVNRNRRTGKGRWKETQYCGTIYDPNKNPKKAVGNKRSFRFEPNKDAAAEFPGRWLMDEFSLDKRFSHQNTEDYVVCCIKHEADRKSRNNVERMTNLEQSIQENSTNTRNANSIEDATAATTLDPEDGLADINVDEIMALFDDDDQRLAAVMEENGRDSGCQYPTTMISSGLGFESSNASTNTNSFLIDTPSNAGHGFLGPLD